MGHSWGRRLPPRLSLQGQQQQQREAWRLGPAAWHMWSGRRASAAGVRHSHSAGQGCFRRTRSWCTLCRVGCHAQHSTQGARDSRVRLRQHSTGAGSGQTCSCRWAQTLPGGTREGSLPARLCTGHCMPPACSVEAGAAKSLCRPAPESPLGVRQPCQQLAAGHHWALTAMGCVCPCAQVVTFSMVRRPQHSESNPEGAAP